MFRNQLLQDGAPSRQSLASQIASIQIQTVEHGIASTTRSAQQQLETRNLISIKQQCRRAQGKNHAHNGWKALATVLVVSTEQCDLRPFLISKNSDAVIFFF